MTDPAGVPGTAKLAPAFLLITTGLKAGQSFRLDRRAIVIGRAEDVDVEVPDRGVSTVHAIIRIDPDGVASIQDLRSTNGTRVNGQKISAAHVLAEGDEISIGVTTTLRFTRDSAAGQRSAERPAAK